MNAINVKARWRDLYLMAVVLRQSCWVLTLFALEYANIAHGLLVHHAIVLSGRDSGTSGVDGALTNAELL